MKEDETITGTATSNAANTAGTSVTINLDKTNPTVTAQAHLRVRVLQ